jgi:hypothetical protein
VSFRGKHDPFAPALPLHALPVSALADTEGRLCDQGDA